MLKIRVENTERCIPLGKYRVPESLTDLAVSLSALEVSFFGGVFPPFHKADFLFFAFSVSNRFICICSE